MQGRQYMGNDALGVHREKEGSQPVPRRLGSQDAEVPAQRSPQAPVQEPWQHEPRRPRWQGCYQRAAIGLDLFAVVVSSALYTQWGTADNLSVLIIGSSVLVLTVCALAVARAWDPLVFGHGSAEFTRLLRGFLGAVVVVAL